MSHSLWKTSRTKKHVQKTGCNWEKRSWDSIAASRTFIAGAHMAWAKRYRIPSPFTKDQLKWRRQNQDSRSGKLCSTRSGTRLRTISAMKKMQCNDVKKSGAINDPHPHLLH